jgi:hypothetical protein
LPALPICLGVMCVGVASSPPSSAIPAGFDLLILQLPVHFYKIVSFLSKIVANVFDGWSFYISIVNVHVPIVTAYSYS